jgi:hypothetical protein
MKEFYLKDNRVNKDLGVEKTLCRVYRRIRWADKTHTRKYKDWKIKVIQARISDEEKDPMKKSHLIPVEPNSWDYIVMHKLPCKLSEIEAYC